MIIPNKRELEKIAFNRSSYTDSQNLMSFDKKCTAKAYFLVIDTTLASDNYSSFRKTLLERI